MTLTLSAHTHTHPTPHARTHARKPVLSNQISIEVKSIPHCPIISIQRVKKLLPVSREDFFFNTHSKEVTLQNYFKRINLLLPSAARSVFTILYTRHQFQQGFYEWVLSLITVPVKLQLWMCALCFETDKTVV